MKRDLVITNPSLGGSGYLTLIGTIADTALKMGYYSVAIGFLALDLCLVFQILGLVQLAEIGVFEVLEQVSLASLVALKVPLALPGVALLAVVLVMVLVVLPVLLSHLLPLPDIYRFVRAPF